MSWLALLSLLAAQSFAKTFATDDLPVRIYPNVKSVSDICIGLDKYGCWFAPPAIREENAPTLLVFIRGWRSDSERSNVPVGQRVYSARQAFSQFGFENLAREKKIAVLVTGAPTLAFGPRQLQDVQRGLNLVFSKIVVASHSAGYQGLDETLSAKDVPHIDRLVMLDNFYMEDSLLDSVTALVKRGTPCNGFYTYHEKPSIQQHQAAFRQICKVENHDDLGHFDTINACLGRYFDEQTCP